MWNLRPHFEVLYYSRSVRGEHGREETETWITDFWNWYGNLVMCRFFACHLKVSEHTTLAWHSGFYWIASTLLGLLWQNSPPIYVLFGLFKISRKGTSLNGLDLQSCEKERWKWLAFVTYLGKLTFDPLWYQFLLIKVVYLNTTTKKISFLITYPTKIFLYYFTEKVDFWC